MKHARMTWGDGSPSLGRPAIESEKLPKTVEERIAIGIQDRKDELIARLNSLIDTFTRRIKTLNKAKNNPDSNGGVMIFGEIQNVSQVESCVGQLIALCEAYRMLQKGNHE